ncbi:MAG: hypothetical protein AB1515_05100 [Nitrospirota bacterium]
MVPARTHERLPVLALGLASFLLIFSAFALFHAYAYDELADTHGCQIGQWVHQGHIVVAAAVILSMALRLLGADVHPPIALVSRLIFCRLSARAPPAFSLS